MSEEIKETLDRTLEYLEGIDKTRNTKILTTNEANILLDYINNLQQKVEQLENIRKEAIEEIQRVLDIWTNKPNEIATLDLEYLLNILNKEDNKNKIKGE